MIATGFALAAFPHDHFKAEVHAFARSLAEKGPLALRGAKRISNARLSPGFAEARLLSDNLRAQLEWSHDVDEAIAEDREGRKPKFTRR